MKNKPRSKRYCLIDFDAKRMRSIMMQMGACRAARQDYSGMNLQQIRRTVTPEHFLWFIRTLSRAAYSRDSDLPAFQRRYDRRTEAWRNGGDATGAAKILRRHYTNKRIIEMLKAAKL